MGSAGRDPDAAQELARLYWKPIYAYIRAARRLGNEEAKDLCQDFFLWMMESDFLSKADRDRGRFRVYVKGAVKFFLSNELRKLHRQKRGGRRAILSLHQGPEDLELWELPDPASKSPDEALDEVWKKTLFTRACSLLEERFTAEGKTVCFQVFRDYFLSGGREMDYKEVAAKYGITVVAVSNYLMEAKRRFRGALSDLVAETVQTPEDLREELRALLGESGP